MTGPVRERVRLAPRLDALFAPRSIALVGASDTSGWTRNVLRSLKVGGYGGDVVVVNPRHRSVAGKQTVPSLRDRPADLAYILTGPGAVPAILEDAAAAGVRNAVVLAAGYGESGPDGRRRQEELTARADDLGITLLGPNSLGFVNPGKCTAYGSALAAAPDRGQVGFVLQSGSLASVLIGYCMAHGVGIRLLAAMGNEAQLGACDVAAYLLADEETSAVAMFLEAIREPVRFRALARESVWRGKPLIVLKSGRSAPGARAALAHTGALASDDAVVDAVFSQDGIVRVSGLEEMIVTSALLGSARRLPAGRRMTAVSSSGGGGNLIADRAAAIRAELPAFADTTSARLDAMLPEFATVQNPLDVTGTYLATVDSARVSKPEDDVLEVAVRDPGLDFAVLVMTPLPASADADGGFSERRLAHLRGMLDASPIPIFLLSLIDRELQPYPRELLAGQGFFVLPGIELGLAAVGHALDWAERRARLAAGDDANPDPAGKPEPLALDADAPLVLDEDAARRLVASFGVPLVPAELVASAAEARAAADAFGEPVAVKLCAAGVAHKTDIGGIRLRVLGGDQAAAAFAAVTAAAAGRDGVRLRGALVAPMRTDGTELIVGVSQDPTFGPVLTVGAGGVWAEAMSDRAIRALPVAREDIVAMLGELRAAPLIFGGRGSSGVDLPALITAIEGVARAGAALGQRLEAIEVNPLLAAASGAEALDVLVVTRTSDG